MKQYYKNKGFSIIGAIFVLVILSLLGLAMMTISAVLHTTSAQTTSGVQAYYAAMSGLEWGVYRATGKCLADHNAICDNPAINSVFTLNGYEVTVSCDDYGVQFDDGNGLFDLDTITVTAKRLNVPVGSPDQISRTVQATATRGEPASC